MRIATNVNALNAWRNLSITNNSLSKTLEKLSSGYRINRAADDAAGLAISEKMRGQIAGINMAVKNAQDGISLIQTAEGAMNEIHAMLTRMEELAVQAANDTNTDEDRAKLQSEMDRLVEEITRIGNTTEFNTKRLLDGTFSGTFHIGANKDQNISFSVGDMRAGALKLGGAAEFALSGTVTDDDGSTFKAADATYTVRVIDPDAGIYGLADANGDIVATSTDGLTYTSLADDSDTIEFTDRVVSGQVTVDSTAGTAAGTASIAADSHALAPGSYTVVDNAGTTEIHDDEGNLVATWAASNTRYEDASGNPVFTPGSGSQLAAGTQITVSAVDISSQKAANEAIGTIQAAVNLVSAQRSDLGALQNRLEHTINNLNVAAENLSAAESRIRDVDMAAEMANFTRNQILLQAGTAMLAQANAAPQSVLQLLG